MKDYTIVTLQNKIKQLDKKRTTTPLLTFKHRLLTHKLNYLREIGREKFGVTIQ